jgi:hypothetical protein
MAHRANVIKTANRQKLYLFVSQCSALRFSLQGVRREQILLLSANEPYPKDTARIPEEYPNPNLTTNNGLLPAIISGFRLRKKIIKKISAQAGCALPIDVCVVLPRCASGMDEG